MIRLDFIEVGIAEVAVCNLHMKETRFVEVRPDALDCLNLCAAETGTAEITVEIIDTRKLTDSELKKSLSVKISA